MFRNVLVSTIRILQSKSFSDDTLVRYDEERGGFLRIGKKIFRAFEFPINKRDHYILIVPVPMIKNFKLEPKFQFKRDVEQLIKDTKFKLKNQKGKYLLEQVKIKIKLKEKGRGQKCVTKERKMRSVCAILAKYHSSRKTAPKTTKVKQPVGSNCKKQVLVNQSSSSSKSNAKVRVISRIKCGKKEPVKLSNKNSVKCSNAKLSKKSVKSDSKIPVKSSKKPLRRSLIKTVAKHLPKSSSLLSRCEISRSQSKNTSAIRPGNQTRIKRAIKQL